MGGKMAIDSGFVVLITSDSLGTREAELGEALMIKFLQEAAGAAILPAKMLFLNAGVTLLAGDSAALPHLRKLEEAGVELRACGTCLEWFDLTDRIVVGKATNMAAIVTELGAAGKVACL
jgi:selenium metabolism protein YedF